MSTFNKESTKVEICRLIKEFEGLIEEESGTEGETEVVFQKITLPQSGKTIRAKGQALKLACELVEAWNKSTQNKVQHPSKTATELKRSPS